MGMKKINQTGQEIEKEEKTIQEKRNELLAEDEDYEEKEEPKQEETPKRKNKYAKSNWRKNRGKKNKKNKKSKSSAGNFNWMKNMMGDLDLGNLQEQMKDFDFGNLQEKMKDFDLGNLPKDFKVPKNFDLNSAAEQLGNMDPENSNFFSSSFHFGSNVSKLT